MNILSTLFILKLYWIFNFNIWHVHHHYPPPPFQSILFCTFLESVCRSSDVCSISFDPFAGKLQNMGQWMPLESSCSLLIFRSQGQRLRSSFWVIFCKFCRLNIFWPLCFDVAKLVQWFPLESRCSLLIFRSYGQMSKSQKLWNKVKP